jgi:hypothetical protein
LGEGKIVDGCITCPWHGYQYRPADGVAGPFTERATFRHGWSTGIGLPRSGRSAGPSSTRSRSG